MSGFNSFLGGLQQGQAAKQRRNVAASQSGAFNAQMQKSQYDLQQAKTNQGHATDAANLYATDPNAARVKAAQSGNKTLLEAFKELDAEGIESVKRNKEELGKFGAIVANMPPEQQSIAIRQFGPNLQLSPEEVERYAANPQMALAALSSYVRDIETAIKQSIPEVRTVGDDLMKIQTGAGGAASVQNIGRRGATHGEIETNRSNLAGEAQSQYANQTDRMNTANKPPSLETLYDEKTGQPYKARYNPDSQSFDRVGGNKAPSGTSLSVGPDGQVNFTSGDNPNGPNRANAGGKFNLEAQKADAKAIEQSQIAAQKNERAIALLDEADIILNGFESGPQSGAQALYGKADAFAGGKLPGDTRKQLSNYERISAISKDLGIEKLQEVGGNDTERELLTAIQTTVGPEKLPETNRAIIAQKRAIFGIVSRRPEFQSDWVRSYGSLQNRDESGASYRDAWGEFQKGSFAEFKASLEQQQQPPRAQGQQQQPQANQQQFESGNGAPKAAIDMLLANPSLSSQFDEKYGEGAAQEVFNGE